MVPRALVSVGRAQVRWVAVKRGIIGRTPEVIPLRVGRVDECRHVRSRSGFLRLLFDDGCEPPGVEVVRDEVTIAIEESEHDVERLAEVGRA